MMAREKRIYILIIKVNKLFFFFSVPVFSKNMFSVFYRVIETLVKVWENSKKLWKHEPQAAFLRHFENAKKRRHFVNKGTLLRYSLSITESIDRG